MNNNLEQLKKENIEKVLEECSEVMRDWIISVKQNNESFYEKAHARIHSVISASLNLAYHQGRKDGVEEVREKIANYTVDLCENSQEFRSFVIKSLNSSEDTK